MYESLRAVIYASKRAIHDRQHFGYILYNRTFRGFGTYAISEYKWNINVNVCYIEIFIDIQLEIFGYMRGTICGLYAATLTNVTCAKATKKITLLYDEAKAKLGGWI